MNWSVDLQQVAKKENSHAIGPFGVAVVYPLVEAALASAWAAQMSATAPRQ